MAPPYLCNLDLIRDLHSHNNRYSLLAYVVPQVNSYGKDSFKYNATTLWNKLPQEIKLINDIKVFKDKVKSLLMNVIVNMENDIYVWF